MIERLLEGGLQLRLSTLSGGVIEIELYKYIFHQGCQPVEEETLAMTEWRPASESFDEALRRIQVKMRIPSDRQGKLERRGRRARIVCPNGHASTDHDIYEVTPVQEWREVGEGFIEEGNRVVFEIDSDPGDPEGSPDSFICGTCEAEFDVDEDFFREYN